MGMCLHYSWTVLYCPSQTRWKTSNQTAIVKRIKTIVLIITMTVRSCINFDCIIIISVTLSSWMLSLSRYHYHHLHHHPSIGNSIFNHDHLECIHGGTTCPFRPHRPRQSWSLWTRQGCRCCEASAGGQPLAADYNDDDDDDVVVVRPVAVDHIWQQIIMMMMMGMTHTKWSHWTLWRRGDEGNKQKFTKTQIYKKRHKNWSHWTFWRGSSGGNSFHGSHWLVSVRV